MKGFHLEQAGGVLRRFYAPGRNRKRFSGLCGG